MRLYILLFLTLFLWTCNTSKKINTEASACDNTGVVKDYSKLDGCKLLIEMEDGTLLRPLSLPPNKALKAEQQISFSYEVIPDAISICMRERMSVKLTCLEVVAP